MLSRKTLGVAGAAILGSMALLVTNTANAAINLTGLSAADGGADTVKMVYAKETLLKTPATNVVEVGEAKTKHYLVTGEAGDLSLVMRSGIAATANTPVYLRIELMNMVFGVSRTGLALTSSGSGGGTHLAGGGAKDNYIVYAVNAGTTVSENLTMALTSIAVLPDMAGSVKVTTHVETPDAIKGEGAIGAARMASDVVRVVSGLTETGTSAESVADVATEFLKFVDGADADTLPEVTAQIGRFMVGIIETPRNAKVAAADDGEALVLADILADPASGHTVTLKGDFSGSDEGGHAFNLQSNSNCDGAGTNIALTFNEAMTATTNTMTVADVNTSSYLCLTVLAANEVAISGDAYMATTSFTAALTAAFPVMGSTTSIGQVGRNGTTVQIPYLTTYEGYNQRIVLSNRGTEEAKYEISFRPEMGVTAMAKDAAEGMLMGNSTVTLKAMDVVELSGGSRTAATIDLVAQPKHIDVTSVTVNMETRGTDTVVHHSGM